MRRHYLRAGEDEQVDAHAHAHAHAPSSQIGLGHVQESGVKFGFQKACAGS